MKGSTCLLGMALLALAGPAPAKVITTNDRFAPGPTVIMSSGDYRYNVNFYITVKVNSSKPIAEQTARIRMKALGGNFEHCFATHWLADDQPVVTPEAEYHGIVSGGELEIHVDLIDETVPWSTIVTLATAQKAEFEICHAQFVVSKADSAQINELMSQVKAALSTP